MLIRIYGSWSWDLSFGDEFHTYLDSLNDPGQRGLFSVYYYLTKVSLTLIGEQSYMAARLPAVLFGLLTILVFYALTTDVFGKSTGVFALAILAVNPWHIEMSQYARYYSAVFFFSLIHFLYFLKYTKSPTTSYLLISGLSGIVATLFHAAAVVVFIPTYLYLLLSVWVVGLLPEQVNKKSLIKLLVGTTAIGLVISLAFVEILSGWLIKSQLNSYGNSWALIPLLALNQFTLPVFVCSFVGLSALKFHYDKSQFVYLCLGLFSAILIVIVLSSVMNFSVNYIFSLAPLFFISAAALCSVFYKSFNSKSALLSYSLVLVLIAAQLPAAVSYFQERRNISYDHAYAYLLNHAPAKATVVTNMGSGLIDVSDLKIKKSKKPPRNRSFKWKKYLDSFKNDNQEIWLAWSVSRIDLAPQLKKWLVNNAQLKYEKKANRIDRREKMITIWRVKK